MKRALAHLAAGLGLSALVLVPAPDAAPTTSVRVYPSAQTITPAGPLPRGSSSRLVLNAAVGEREAGLVVVSDAHSVGVRIDRGGLGPLGVKLRFAHFVAFGSRLVPDALLPWDGEPIPAERPNQPLYLQIVVPYGTQPGTYRGSVHVIADGRETPVPLTVRVFPLALPQPAQATGNLLTSFHLLPGAYVNTAAELYGYRSHQQRIAANTALYAFLAAYRISPASWGFGEPRTASGYATSPRWWLDSAANMTRQVQAGPGFSALRIPISNNRTSPRSYIGGLSPFEPETWCDYLAAVHGFWAPRGWLAGNAVPYLYALDEPSGAGKRLIARQASVAHRCFPGAKVLATTNPSPNGSDGYLLDNRGGDDVDIWAVPVRRFYGSFRHRARLHLRAIERARGRGKQIWAYTYSGPDGTPTFRATEPLANPRMVLLWAALQGIEGVLYGQGTTNYGRGNPLQNVDRGGEFVLLYPGNGEPIPSARLEQIRDGIEDWAIYAMVRGKHGAGRVRALLGGHGLFSAHRAGVRLACTQGCDLRSATKYSWPRWSRGASTARRIEAARLEALRLAS